MSNYAPLDTTHWFIWDFWNFGIPMLLGFLGFFYSRTCTTGQAQVNLSSLEVNLIRHDEPFIEDPRLSLSHESYDMPCWCLKLAVKDRKFPKVPEKLERFLLTMQAVEAVEAVEAVVDSRTILPRRGHRSRSWRLKQPLQGKLRKAPKIDRSLRQKSKQGLKGISNWCCGRERDKETEKLETNKVVLAVIKEKSYSRAWCEWQTDIRHMLLILCQRLESHLIRK